MRPSEATLTKCFKRCPQLKNWGDYLDFEIKRAAKEGGDPRTVEVLFERCLIACALYEEFWSKYAEYLEGRKMDDKEKDDEKVSSMLKSLYLR